MLLLFLGCRGYFDSAEEVDTFLDDVTNRWWHLQDDGSNFYLEREGDDDIGMLWLDFFWGPYCSLEYNVDGGNWEYEPNNNFEIVYENLNIQLGVHEHPDLVGCWKVNYGILYTDVACPYLDDCNTIY